MGSGAAPRSPMGRPRHAPEPSANPRDVRGPGSARPATGGAPVDECRPYGMARGPDFSMQGSTTKEESPQHARCFRRKLVDQSLRDGPPRAGRRRVPRGSRDLGMAHGVPDRKSPARGSASPRGGKEVDVAELVNFTPTFVPNAYPDRVQATPSGAPRRADRRGRGPGAGRRAQDLAFNQGLADEDPRPRRGWLATVRGEQSARDAEPDVRGELLPELHGRGSATRHCGAPPCPFCWVRRSLAVWEAADYAFFESPEARRGAGADAPPILPRSLNHDLVEWTVTVPDRVPIQDRKTEALKDLLHSNLASLIGTRTGGLSTPGEVGALA